MTSGLLGKHIFQISQKEEQTKTQPQTELMSATAEINTMPTGNMIESVAKNLGVSAILFSLLINSTMYVFIGNRKIRTN